MKHQVSRLLTLLLLCMASLSASAHDVCIEGIYYDLVTEGTEEREPLQR